MIRPLLALFAAAALAMPVMANDASLLPNGDFQFLRDNAPSPDGWASRSPDARWLTEGGNRFVRLTSTEPGKTVSVYKAYDIAEGQKAFELSCRARYDNVVVGEKKHFDGRVLLNFKDAGGKVIGYAAAPNFVGSSKGAWEEKRVKFAVPEGAVVLEIIPSLLDVKSGTIDFDDIALKTIDPATLPKKYDMHSPVVPPPPADKLPKPLRVDGNVLRDSDGNEVWLQGLSTDSLQWNPNGERTVPTIEYAIDKWNANCIRLAISEALWFGRHESQTDGGARYRQIIDSAINTAAGRGKYIVLDLHRFRAPEQKHLDFWKDLAPKYANHPAVIYELFNEPYGITWEIWRDGGEVTDKPKAKDGVALETTEGMKTFTAIGMQAMLDAVRETGAKNVVVIGGLDFSYDLSGVLKGYDIKERGGNGIVYSTHVYPWKSKWQEKFLDVAAKHPLFIGEVGTPGSWEKYKYIPVSQQHEKVGPGATWPNDMLALIQKHKLNWTAFSFHPKCGPEVIKNWDYEPTEAWGVYVKEALSGKQFTSDKMR
jgi:endoglucanase